MLGIGLIAIAIATMALGHDMHALDTPYAATGRVAEALGAATLAISMATMLLMEAPDPCSPIVFGAGALLVAAALADLVVDGDIRGAYGRRGRRGCAK